MLGSGFLRCLRHCSTSCRWVRGTLIAACAALAGDRSAQLLRVARQDVALADDTSVLDLEHRIRDDLAPAGELAGDGGGRAILSRDRVLHRRLDAGGGAVLEHPLQHFLAVPNARGARRVVAVDLDHLDLVRVEREQDLDVPLLVAAPDVSRSNDVLVLTVIVYLLRCDRLTVRGLPWHLEARFKSRPDLRWMNSRADDRRGGAAGRAGDVGDSLLRAHRAPSRARSRGRRSDATTRKCSASSGFIGVAQSAGFKLREIKELIDGIDGANGLGEQMRSLSSQQARARSRRCSSAPRR